jgi:RND family efflux transporter MFP subunit
MKKLRRMFLWIAAGLLLVALAAGQAQRLNLKCSLLPSREGSGNAGLSPADQSFADCVIAEGRVAAYHGEQVTLSAEMAGRIEKLLVDEKGVVCKGGLVAEINVDDLKAARAEAKARLAEIDAEIRLAAVELKRQKKLRDEAVASPDELDRAQRNFDLATAQRVTAEATVNRLEATVAKALVHSPIDGVVLARHAHPGEMASPGTRLVTIANTNRTRIEAEVDEFDMGRVCLGQSVKVTAEAFPGAHWQGVVEEIPDAVSEKNLKPLDPGRPSDARVLRVKIALKKGTPLKLGQRVEVEMGLRRH